MRREVQRVLNPIVFNRRSKLFFKVSTESSNSFERQGLHGKPLEILQDFELIDLATESLHQEKRDKTVLLENIFMPRITRHELLKGKNFSLRDVLGKTKANNNELARQMRDAVQAKCSQRRKGNPKVFYHGVDAFVGMWASETRIMIQIFTGMLREANGTLRRNFKRKKKVSISISTALYITDSPKAVFLIQHHLYYFSSWLFFYFN